MDESDTKCQKNTEQKDADSSRSQIETEAEDPSVQPLESQTKDFTNTQTKDFTNTQSLNPPLTKIEADSKTHFSEYHPTNVHLLQTPVFETENKETKSQTIQSQTKESTKAKLLIKPLIETDNIDLRASSHQFQTKDTSNVRMLQTSFVEGENKAIKTQTAESHTTASTNAQLLQVKPLIIGHRSPTDNGSNLRSTGQNEISNTDDETGHSLSSLPWDDVSPRTDISPGIWDSQDQDKSMETEL